MIGAMVCDFRPTCTISYTTTDGFASITPRLRQEKTKTAARTSYATAHMKTKATNGPRLIANMRTVDQRQGEVTKSLLTRAAVVDPQKLRVNEVNDDRRSYCL